MATIGIDIGPIEAKALLGPRPSGLHASLGVSIAAHLAIGLAAIVLLRLLPSETASQAPETIEVSIVSGLPEPATPPITTEAMLSPPPPEPVTTSLPAVPSDSPAPPSAVQDFTPALETPQPSPPAPVALPAPIPLEPAPPPIETASMAPVPPPAKPKPAKPVQKPRAKATPPLVKPAALPPSRPSSAATDPAPAAAQAEVPSAAPVSATLAAASAPSPAPETRKGIEDAVPLILNPHFRERPEPPAYPKRAMELDQQGETLVRARLDSDGNPAEIVVWRTSGFDLLDHAAMEAVRRWRFEPAKRDGHPIPAWVQVPIHFALN